MSTKWTDPKKAKALIDQLVEAQRPGKESSIVFEGHRSDLPLFLLPSLARFPDEIPEHLKEHIVVNAVFDAARKKRLNVGGVSEEIKARQARYLNRPKQAFTIVTSVPISLASEISLRPVRMNNAYIQFHQRIPSHLKRDDMGTIVRRLFPMGLPGGYANVTVRVQARCEHSAAERALDALDLLRGLWNFHLNRNGGIRTTGAARPDPVNRIVLGPLHTVHDANGQQIPRIYWWEPSYVLPAQLVSFTHGFDDLKRAERWFRRRLRLCRFQPSLERALLKYTRALDDPLMSTSFLKLWSTLEFITASGRAGHERTVKRATFFFRDRVLHEEMLDRLRVERNTLVHEGSDFHKAEESVFRLMHYVHVILDYLFAHGHRFQTLEEFGSLLDLPASRAELLNKQRQLERESSQIAHALTLFTE